MLYILSVLTNCIPRGAYWGIEEHRAYYFLLQESMVNLKGSLCHLEKSDQGF
jgi:hypothetical protein